MLFQALYVKKYIYLTPLSFCCWWATQGLWVTQDTQSLWLITGENSSPWQQLGNVDFNPSPFFSMMWELSPGISASWITLVTTLWMQYKLSWNPDSTNDDGKAPFVLTEDKVSPAALSAGKESWGRSALMSLPRERGEMLASLQHGSVCQCLQVSKFVLLYAV